MLLPNQWAINDPFPLVLRRPRPPTPADLECDSWNIFQEIFEQSVEEIRARQYKYRTVDGKTQVYSHDQGRWFDVFAGIADKVVEIWSPPGPPKEIGDYIASRDREDCWARHWNGYYWSSAWAHDPARAAIVAESNRKKFGDKFSKKMPTRAQKAHRVAPDQGGIWFLPTKLPQ